MSAGFTLTGALAAKSNGNYGLTPAPAVASRLLLLGTGGGPVLGGERGMSSSAIVVDSTVYVIDCGYGAAAALARQGVSLAQIRSIFITHNHADHILDYGAILFFSWLQGRTAPIVVYGPAPLRDMTTHILATNAVPLKYYAEDMGMQSMPDVAVQELTGQRTVMDDEYVRVSCTEVHHPPVLPSLAYRFDLKDRSIVFSGDTSPSENLIQLAKGADLLVHEAADASLTLQMMGSGGRHGNTDINGRGGVVPSGYDAQKFRDHVYSAHTSAEDAGRIAAAAGVKTLVLNHLSPGSSSILPDNSWIAAARLHFDGRIIVGHDGLAL